MRPGNFKAGLMAAALAAAQPAGAGVITGLISAKGPAGAAQAQAGGAYQDMRYRFAERVDYDHLEDFVVYIDQPLPEGAAEAPQAKGTITQRDVSFDPRVLPIAVGTAIRWPNADTIYHNVFSMSETRSFDLGLYTKEKVPEIVFDKPGRVDVFCSIHSTMHCIVLVLPNRCFAKVNANRRYVLPSLPAGTYKVKAWHERLPAKTVTVTVPEQGEVRVDFTLGLADLPKQ